MAGWSGQADEWGGLCSEAADRRTGAVQGKNHNTLLGCFIQEYVHVFNLNSDNWGMGWGQNENYWDIKKLNNHRNGPIQKMEHKRNDQKIPTQ